MNKGNKKKWTTKKKWVTPKIITVTEKDLNEHIKVAATSWYKGGCAAVGR